MEAPGELMAVKANLWYWGGCIEDFLLRGMLDWCIFDKSKAEALPRRHTWIEALLLFIFIAGDKAPFLRKIKTAREAQWKIRMLCMGILKTQGVPIDAEPDMGSSSPTRRHQYIGPLVLVNLNEEYLMMGKPLRKLYITMEQVGTSITCWRHSPDFASLVVRSRLNAKKAGPVLPGLNQAADRTCIDFGALTSVQERISACKVLLREFLLEKVPLGFLGELDAEQVRDALGNSCVRRLRFCIGRRRHLMSGWASRLAGAPGLSQCFGSAWDPAEPQRTLCGFTMPWTRLGRYRRMPRCKVYISELVTQASCEARIAELSTQIDFLVALLSRLGFEP